MKGKKILMGVTLCAFIFCAVCIMGCSSSNNAKTTLTTLADNISKVSTILDKVQDIDTSELIIPDFMDEKSLSTMDAKNYSVPFENAAMSSYIAKITLLNNNVISTITVNDKINYMKQQLYSKSSYAKALCSQTLSQNIDFGNEKISSLNELNNTLVANYTRVSLTRNEITNNYKSVDNLKSNYSNKPDQLNSKYTKLKSSLNTRLTYYINIANTLDDITNLLSTTYDLDREYINDDYIFPNEDKTKNELEKPIKTGITKNIDTYENAGTNIYGDYRNNPIYNPDNYLRNYNPGYGMNGFGYGANAYGYGGYGMNGFGFNGMYPNGYGMNGYGMYGYGNPYGNGYIYPNINTFGTYKNIDTYRSKQDLNKELLENSDSIYEEKQSDELSKDYTDTITKTRSLDKSAENDNQEEHFVDNQEKPNLDYLMS